MSQSNLDKLVLLALFLTVVGDLIGLFVELKNQRQTETQEQSEKTVREQILDLHNEIKLLKIQLETSKE